MEARNMHTCIAIDDEPFALELIREFCDRIPFLQLLKTFNNPFEAATYLATNKPDVVLLDIKMPEISGIQLIKGVKGFPAVIFTTAHSSYAVESYDLEALDYLLKPFDFERFYRAVSKVRNMGNKAEIKPKEEGHFIIVRAEYKSVKIFHNAIVYVEAMDNYIKIFTDTDCIITKCSMKSILELLPEKEFCRIHKSYIISVARVSYYSKKEVKLESKSIPIGRTYRNEFVERVRLNKTKY